MTKTRPIPFAEFRAFLAKLGYEEKPHPRGRVFEHPAEGLLLFRYYRDGDTVHPRDLLSTRSFLDQRGVIAADEYDAQFLRLNTPA